MIEITFTQQNLENFLIILVRITSFIFISPFFGHKNVPMRFKLGFGVFLSFILYNVMPIENLAYDTTIDYALLVIKESIAGLLIGFAAFICNTIILFAGNIIDMEIGMSMAQIFDPVTNSQVSMTGNFYYYMVFVLLIVSNMHLFLLNAIVDSYSLIPIGGANMGDTLYNTVLGFITNYFIIGFRITLPIFVASLILNCVLGILVKVVPQLNMFSVGIQIKILVGFTIIFVTVALIPSIANFIFEQMQSMVAQVMRGMQ